MNIQSINGDFNYNNITLGNPQSIQGGSYFTKIFSNDSTPLYIQLPKCATKQGIISTKKSKYCDLMYERNDSNLLIEWIEKIEETLLKIISDKKDIWFHNELTNSDIETMINPISRSFKSGKYILIRTNLDCNKHTGKSKCIGYDEKEIHIDIETLEASTQIIPLILLEGIRFTSRSFEIDVKLIQFMTIDNTVVEHKCLIKKTSKKEPVEDNSQKQMNGELLAKIDTSVSGTMTDILSDTESPPPASPEPEPALEPASLAPEPEPASLAPEPESSPKPDPGPTPAPTPESSPKPEHEPAVTPKMEENEEKSPKTNSALEKNEIEEITLDIDENLDEIKIREPNEIYYEIYKTAKKKASELKTKALKAHLEAKQIKVKYMLDDSDESDDDENLKYLE